MSQSCLIYTVLDYKSTLQFHCAHRQSRPCNFFNKACISTDVQKQCIYSTLSTFFNCTHSYSNLACNSQLLCCVHSYSQMVQEAPILRVSWLCHLYVASVGPPACVRLARPTSGMCTKPRWSKG